MFQLYVHGKLKAYGLSKTRKIKLSFIITAFIKISKIKNTGFQLRNPRGQYNNIGIPLTRSYLQT